MAEQKIQQFRLDLDVYADLQALVAAARIEAAREGRPLRPTETFSGVVNSAIRAEIKKRQGKKAR